MRGLATLAGVCRLRRAACGVRPAEQVRNLAPHTDGVVVGSALVEQLESGGDPVAFLKSLRPLAPTRR